MNTELKNAYCFSLRPDTALMIATGAVDALIFSEPIEYTGIVFIAGAPCTDESEIPECTEELSELGLDETFVDLDAIVGYAQLTKCVEYTNDAQWQKDSELHGYDVSFEEVKSEVGDRVFAYYFGDQKMLTEFIWDMEAQIGDVWKPEHPADTYAFREALKTPTVD